MLDKLIAMYPQCPISLINLLSMVDGTYWRRYGDSEIGVLILGSDLYEYPYYLQSTEQILASAHDVLSQTSIEDIYGEALDYVEVDPRIDPKLPQGQWLHFSDCMNNGGTSRLYIDFNPTALGQVGQVIRYVHDPDEYKVIADSFDMYLQKLIDTEFDFVLEEYYVED